MSCGKFHWNKEIRIDKEIRCQSNHLCPSCCQKNVDKIFAQATCDVWKERVDSGECTLYEAETAIKRAAENGSLNLKAEDVQETSP